MRSEAVLRDSPPAVVSTLRPEYTFTRFVRGESNRLAYAASLAVAENPARIYNPLFIYSASGLGKTHLLHAIGNEAARRFPWLKILYVTCERFATEFYRALQEGKTAQFRKTYRSADILLLDDVHFLREKAAIQEELLHTFNDLYQRGKQIVLTSTRSPEALPHLPEGLISRFGWGLVAEIQPPDAKTRLAILRTKAEELQLELPPSILEYIAERVRSNVRALEGALVRLTATISLNGHELSEDALKDVLPPPERPKFLTPELIKREVARYYQISVEDLEGESRERRIACARQIAIYLARELTERSFPALGMSFGGRDHTTIMHAYRKAKALAESPLFAGEIAHLKAQLLALAERTE
ncbi:MAG: chromosomal replication initiator protein DnaA [Candidatus Bipolaricaulota bacterium]|nr:chromosomal replication initiator protein DnaA [Candidatus Bipolaricaulota bacterium]MDW8030606.1 chromosomal replication initiator protein DnaA [Candidatus Bipolaricaulota bacterium]